MSSMRQLLASMIKTCSLKLASSVPLWHLRSLAKHQRSSQRFTTQRGDVSQKPECTGAALEGTLTLPPDLGVFLSMLYLSARELTIISCASLSMQRAASQNALWKSLWRARYGEILWSVPADLRCVDVGKTDRDAIRALRTCLTQLRMPPRWWVEEPQESYAEELARLEERVGPQKLWKLFYFAFGLHWPKWAVAEHSNGESCWVVIHGKVFDMTHFDSHPGGKEPFMRFAGLDATEAFEAMGHSWLGKNAAFEDELKELLVQSLQLAEEGNILSPAWQPEQDLLPPWKRWVYGLLLWDVDRKLSYHDFW
eukprot:TRINITY_DN39632_c0_g1_i1.p1 TRINITY_DN39632_c0_g1~~TRINITY_DN39632_c0_g1_i1.p1  ORF type:complete len:310 (+),score=52.29 TRINITY_DN39632_c0_g1_i1:28-957(+)